MENAENLIPVTFSTAFFLPGQMFLVSLLKNTWTIIQAHHGHCEVVLAQVLVEGKNRNRKTFTLNKTCVFWPVEQRGIIKTRKLGKTPYSCVVDGVDVKKPCSQIMINFERKG